VLTKCGVLSIGGVGYMGNCLQNQEPAGETVSGSSTGNPVASEAKADAVLAFSSVAEYLADKTTVHIKGFGSGMPPVYHADALAGIKSYDVVVWDGDPLEDGGFTELVPQYLAANPTGVALAFKLSTSVSKFLDSWSKTTTAYPGRVRVVPVELPMDAISVGITAEVVAADCEGMPEFFTLGRTAIRATGSKTVVSLGGGGISAREAKAGLRDDGTAWTVFAVGRGRKEEKASLCDFVLSQAAGLEDGGLLTLVRGKDPKEGDAFYGTG